jgi:hypothetical protein
MSRKTLLDTPLQSVGMFAVMRHSSKLKRAHFMALHGSYEAASTEAIRLVMEQAKSDPQWQHNYYVMEVAARFSAGVDGLQSEERSA